MRFTPIAIRVRLTGAEYTALRQLALARNEPVADTIAAALRKVYPSIMKITPVLAERVAQRMRRDGFACSRADVLAVAEEGTLAGRESLASRILQELEELGITVAA